MNNLILRTICLSVLTLTCCANGALANDQVPGRTQQKPILVRNATIHTVDAGVIKKGAVLFDNGQIVSVGRKVSVPKRCQVINGDGSHVYPGLIESMTDLGLREVLAVGESVDSSEFGQKNPNVRAWVAVNPDSELIPVARAGGVLIAHVSPGGQWIRGQTSVMQLDGWTAAEMNLRAPVGLSIRWSPMMPKDKDPTKQTQKRREKLKELDQWFDQAIRYGESQSENPNSITSDLRLEAMLPVLSGDLPMFVEANEQAEIESAVAFAVRRGLRLVIYGGYDAEECAELLKRFDVPVIIAGTYRLPRHRDDAYDAAYTLPSRLKKAGVRFAICGEGPGYPGGSSNARNLPYHAGCAVAYGLSRADAVRAITLSAAEILGVQDRIGSITAGKDATLIICDGDILETKTNVSAAFIQGRAVDLTSRHTMLFEKYQKKYRDR